MAAAIVVAVVAAVALQPHPSNASSPAPRTVPLGTALALSAVVSNGPIGTDWYYNFSVQSASSGLTLANLTFQVRSSMGGTIAMPAGSSVLVLSITNCGLGVYNFNTTLWAPPATAGCGGVVLGAGAGVTNGQEFSVNTTANLQNVGDTLVIGGRGLFSGDVTLGIP